MKFKKEKVDKKRLLEDCKYLSELSLKRPLTELEQALYRTYMIKLGLYKPVQPTKQLKIMKDITAYRGLDGSTYGPYKHGRTIKICDDEAVWLIKCGLAEQVG